jgi:ferredoxin
MADASIAIHWPDGSRSDANPGESWLEAARRGQQLIPTACRQGSCGACEIEVNGNVIRACISSIPATGNRPLQVSLSSDPYW